MIFQSLSDYVNANAPMTNLPELLNLHHSNPLGFHPIVIPLFLLVIAIALHFNSYGIFYKEQNKRFILLYSLLVLATLSTYYYCFSDDLPQFRDWQLNRKEICIGWFCQRDIVGIGWSLMGEVMLTYIVYCFLSALMQMVEYIGEDIGAIGKHWSEWHYVIFVMLLGASVAGVTDMFAPIAGVWIMLGYQLAIIIIIVTKLIADIIRTHDVRHRLLATISFFIGIEAVTMLAIECIEGYIYIFLPVVALLSIASTRYMKSKKKV